MTPEATYSGPREADAYAGVPDDVDRRARDTEDLSLVDLLIVVAEQRRMILWVAIASALLGVVVSLLLPSRYTATVTLLPPQQNSPVSSAIASQVGSLTGMAALAGTSFGFKNPNEMYVGMLKSRTVEDAMVQHFKLMQEYRDRYASDARKDFENHTTIDGSAKDGMIHISIEDHNPGRAAELANGYVDQFRSLSEHLALTEAAQRRVFFERQLNQAKENLANAEEALKKTEQTTGLIQLDSQARALIESAASLRAQITALKVRIQAMETYATSENANLVQAQRQLAGLQGELAKLGGSESDNTGEILVPKGKVPTAGLEYIRKVRDVKYYETIFEIFARQFEFAKLDEAKQGALIQVVDAAVPPDKRSFPKRTLTVLAASFAGLVFGILVAFARTALRNMTNDPEIGPKIDNLRRAMKSPVA